MLRKSRWCLTALLIAVMTVMLAFTVSAADSTENMPGYILDGEVSGSTFTAKVYLSGANSTAGGIALRFDQTKLELVNSSSLASAVVPGEGVTITQNGLADSVTVSQADGRVLVSWFPSGLRLDASAENKLVCTISFNLKSGVTANDLDAASLRLYDIRKGQYANWECGAKIFAVVSDQSGGDTADLRKYNIFGSPACYVKSVYPGSDRVPAAAHKVVLDVKDILGQQVQAQVMVNGCLLNTDSQGQLVLNLVDGTYSYQVYTDAMEKVLSTFTVNGADTTVNVSLKNDALVAQRAANDLKITYAQGDSAGRVTQSVKLPLTAGNQIYVFWSSDKPEVIAKNGTLTPVTAPTTVVLTATVMKNAAEAKREFTLVAVPEGYQGELPDVGEGDGDDSEGGDNTGTDNGNGNGNSSGTGTGTGTSGGNSGSTSTGTGTGTSTGTGTGTGTGTNTGTGTSTGTDGSQSTGGKKFTDLNGYSWAESAINSLAEKGIINGVTATTYNPGGSITRADFTCLLMRMLLPEGELADTEFSDVPKSAYYYNEVMRAKALGIVTGSTGGKFNPRDNITRQDMVLITYRAMEALGYITAQESAEALNAFSDGGDVQSYASLGVAAAVENGWIQGASNNQLQPKRNCTRAEAAVFIERIYNIK